MPSLWKKQKGNRLTRLVADLQSPPKRGGSLVVETGFPTSIVDLFVKNRDRLKKPSKKKHRLKQQTTTTAPTTTDESFPILTTPVSDSPISLPELNVPSPSIGEKKQENVAQNNISEFFVQKIVAQENPCVQLSRDCCKDENEEDEVAGDNKGASNSNNGVWLSVLKWALILVVPLYTKRLVVGITLGALLLLLLEYVGNSVIRFFRLCEDAKRELQGFSPGWNASKSGRKIGEGSREKMKKRVLNRTTHIDLKEPKEGGNEVVFKRAIKEEVGNRVVLKWEIGNDAASRRDIEQEIESVTAPKGEIEQGNARASLIWEGPCLDEGVRNQPVHEIETLEPNFSVWTKNPNRDSPGGYCELQCRKGAIGEEEIEKCRMVDPNGKTKKRKKFWKKFVLKRIHRKKKHTNKEQYEAGCGCEVPTDCIEEIIAELEEEDDPEVNEQEMANGEESSLSSSSDEEELGARHFGVASDSNTEMLHFDNRTRNTCGALKKQVSNLKSLSIVGITLAGLIRSRIFALILTVICCLMFKMVRS